MLCVVRYRLEQGLTPVLFKNVLFPFFFILKKTFFNEKLNKMPQAYFLGCSLKENMILFAFYSIFGVFPLSLKPFSFRSFQKRQSPGLE